MSGLDYIPKILQCFWSQVKNFRNICAVFGTFLARNCLGKPFTVVGDGEQKRDFTCVDDAVDV